MKRKITSTIGVLAIAIGGAVTAGSGMASADTSINGCNIVSAPAKTRFTNCPGVDFTGANLDRVDLSYANLEGANFSGVTSFISTRLSDTNLKNASFEGKDLRRVTWLGGDATGGNFVGANLSGTSLLPRLTNADLTGANLSKLTTDGGSFLDGAIMKGVTFEQSNLRGSNMKGADLTDAKFNFADMTAVKFSSSTKLTGADLSDTLLDQINFTDTVVMPESIVATADSGGGAVVSWSDPTDVVGVSLTDCTPASGSRFEPNANVVDCKVQSVSSLGLPLKPGLGRFFVTVSASSNPNPVDPNPVAAEILARECARYVPNPDPADPNKVSDCAGAALSGVNLAGVNLTRANLYGANLTGANLTGASLTGAEMYGASLSRANLTNANLNGANLTYAYPINADLTRANLTRAKLAGANLTNANLNGANLNGADLTNAILSGANLTGSSVIPGNISVPAQSAAGATATWTAPTPPTGLTLKSCTPVSGTLFPIGLTTVTCTVGNDKGFGTGTFTVTVDPVPVAPVFADTSAVALNGTVGTALTRTFAVTGTPKPAVTVVAPAQLPPGMTFANDPVTGVPTMSGTPTTAGSYTFTLTAGNGVGTPKTLGVTVNVALAPVAPVFADTSTVALNGIAGTELTHTFATTGNPAPTLTSTGLPTGLTMSTIGVLSGTPSAAGSFSVTITATNGVGTPATLNVTLTVAAAPAAPMFTDAGPVTLHAVAGTALTRAFTVTGNPTPAITVIDPAKLPTGMTFADGVLSGTPTVAGTYTFILQAANSVNPDLTLTVTVNVTAAPVVDPPATGSLGSLGSIFGS